MDTKPFPALYPFVASIVTPDKFAKGPWHSGRPTGITLHYTADRNKDRAINALRERGLGYHLVIDRDGKVTQLCYLDKRTDHAGPSSWEGQSCNQNHIAVAVVSWGKVDMGKAGGFYSWSQDVVPVSDVALRPYNVSRQPDYWDAITSTQEDTLMAVLKWLCSQGISSANVCGHDEAALPPGRKIDPGGALQFTVRGIRAILGMH